MTYSMKQTTTRTRSAAILAGAVAIGLALVGCAGGTGGTEGGTAAGSGDGTFPVTIDTAYGEITVTEKPERIVAFTLTHVELLDVLGEEPIAYTYGLVDDLDTVLEESPWVEDIVDLAPDATLMTVDYAPSAEAVAALDPDLILAVPWVVDEALYAQLSQIAPTYVGLDAAGTSWQDDLASLAALTGHDAGIVADTEAALAASYAATAERLGGVQGATFQVAVGDSDQLFGLYDYANASMLALGLEPGEGQPIAGEASSEDSRFSLENIERLDADVVLVAIPGYYDPDSLFRSALESDPRLAELPSAKNGTFVFLSEAQWSAVNGGTPASITWWLGQDTIAQLEGSTLNTSGR